jgi:protein arginine kinase activator
MVQVFNGQKVESHLCEECAAKKGGIIFNFSSKYAIPNLLGSIFGSSFNMPNMVTPAQTTCPNCGVSFADIRQTGKLGCSECYKVYEQELEPTLKRIHGSSQHFGKIPSRGGEKVLLRKEIDELKVRLQEAVAQEEYEKAAEIRDRIKELESSLT